MRDWIKSRTALNHRELCKLIEWSPSSFHQWLNDKRPDSVNYKHFYKLKNYELDN